MSNYILYIKQNNEIQTVKLNANQQITIDVQPDTQYQIVDAEGNLISQPTNELVGNDLIVYLNQDKEPSLILQNYANNYPLDITEYLNQTGSTFATAKNAEEALLLSKTVVASEVVINTAALTLGTALGAAGLYTVLNQNKSKKSIAEPTGNLTLSENQTGEKVERPTEKPETELPITSEKKPEESTEKPETELPATSENKPEEPAEKPTEKPETELPATSENKPEEPAEKPTEKPETELPTTSENKPEEPAEKPTEKSETELPATSENKPEEPVEKPTEKSETELPATSENKPEEPVEQPINTNITINLEPIVIIKPVINLGAFAGDDVLTDTEAAGDVTISGRVQDGYDGQVVRVRCGCPSCTGSKWIEVEAIIQNGEFTATFNGAEVVAALGENREGVITADYTATNNAQSSVADTAKQIFIRRDDKSTVEAFF